MSLLTDIKESAQKNRTKIQSSEATNLEKILNNTFYLPKRIKEETAFIKQVMTRGAETQERKGLHASELIKGDKDYCCRKQVLSLVYRQLQGEQIPIGLQKIFEEGNAVHEKWQRLFIRAGYSTANDLDVTQYNEKYMISFTPDIICTIPEFYKGRMVGEVKSVNTYQFQKMVKHPSASKQLQFYMFLTGIHKGFVLSEDKNTQDIKLEVYDFDLDLVKKYIDRAEEIQTNYRKLLKEHKMVKRPKDAISPECKRCAKCALKNSCWNLQGGKQKL